MISAFPAATTSMGSAHAWLDADPRLTSTEILSTAIFATWAIGMAVPLTVCPGDRRQVNSGESQSPETSNDKWQIDSPRTVVGQWLDLVLADNIRDRLTLTTNSEDLHARRPLLRLRDKEEVRVVRSLGNESVAFVVTNSVKHVGSKRERAFAFWLVRRNDSWLINMSYVDDPESIEEQLRGFFMGGGGRWHVTKDDLVGTWRAGPGPPGGVGNITCGSRFQLEADGSFTLETWGPGGSDDGTDIQRGTWRLEEDLITREQNKQRLVSRISWMDNDSLVLQQADRKSGFGKLGTEYQREPNDST